MLTASVQAITVRITPDKGGYCALACDAVSGDFVRRSHSLPDVAERAARDALAAQQGRYDAEAPRALAA